MIYDNADAGADLAAEQVYPDMMDAARPVGSPERSEPPAVAGSSKSPGKESDPSPGKKRKGRPRKTPKKSEKMLETPAADN